MGIKRFGSWLASPHGVILFAIVAVHVALVFRHFPPSALIDGALPVKGDLSRYLATVHGSRRVSGMHGYDPNFLAGYPVGLWNSMGKKGYELCAALAPPEYDSLAVYVAVVSAALLAPFLIAAAPLLGSRKLLDVVVAAALAFFAWHFSTQAAYFWHFGNVFFPFTCCLIPIALMLAERVAGDSRPIASMAALCLIAAIAFYFHTAASLVLWGVLAARTGYAAVRGNGAALGRLLVTGTLALALISPWLLALLSNRENCLSQPDEWFQSSVRHLICDVFSDRAYQHAFDRNAFLQAFAVTGVTGIFGLSRRYRDTSAGGDRLSINTTLWAGFAGVGCLLIAYTGSYLPGIKAIQPYRFLTPAVLLHVGPSAFAIRECLQAFERAPIEAKRVMAVMTLLIAPGLTGYGLDALQPPTRFGLSNDQQQTLQAIAELPGEGRVLVDNIEVGHVTPQVTGRAVIGGLSDQAFLLHRFAGIDGKGVLFGRPAADWERDALREYLRVYAVEYAMFTAPDWKRYAQGAPDLFEPLTTDDQSGYRVIDSEPSLLLRGQAEVMADYDVIRVSNVQSERLVIKLHFDKHFVTDSGVEIRPINLLDDPLPFIELVVPDSVREFTLTYQAGW